MAAGEDTVRTPASIGAGSNVERQSGIASVSVSNTTVSRSACTCTADMDSISRTVQALQHTLTAETLANRENKILFQTTAHTLKKELSELLEEEISKATKAHQQELEAQEKKHIAWKVLLEERYQKQEALVASLQAEVKQLKLRTCLLDSASPAFVSVSGVSSITAKSPPRKSHPFYSHPCGYKMTLSLGRDPQGGLFILLNIAGGDYEKLLQWPFLGKIIVEIVGFSALDQTQTVRGLIGVLETDEKSGIHGGGGYVGQVISRLLRSQSDVLQLLEKQTKGGAKEALADPYYYLEEDTLHFRITTALHTSCRSICSKTKH